MTRSRPLEEDVGELLTRPHTRRSVERAVSLDGLEVAGNRVPDHEPVALDLVLESLPSAIRMTGRVRTRFEGSCRRCLDPLERPLEATVSEIFEVDPTEDETWPIVDDRIDLEPPLREALLLALPLAPLCREDCGGPDPERFPTGVASDADAEPAPDPRWAALDDLDFD